MRSKRTRRLNKKYRRSQKIGKKSKRIKKKRSRRVKKIIHKGGQLSGEYQGLPGANKPVNERLPPLYGRRRDPGGNTHDTPRADVKASDSSKDNLFAGRKPEKPEQTSYEMAGNSSGELTSWEKKAAAAAVKETGSQRRGVLSDPHLSQRRGVLSDPHLKASLDRLEGVRTEGEKNTRLNDINKCYPKNPWSYNCGEHPDAKDKYYLSTGLSKIGIFTEPKKWSEYKYPVTDMENGKEYCCNEP